MTSRISELKLLSAEEEFRKFPLRKQAMQQRAESVRKQIEVEKQKQQKRQTEDMAKLAEAQKLKLNKARAEVDKAQAERNHARQEMEKYIRLSQIADGGGGRLQRGDRRRRHRGRAGGRCPLRNRRPSSFLSCRRDEHRCGGVLPLVSFAPR